LEAVVRRRTRAKLGRIQSFPLAAGAQDKQNGIHTNPVVGTGATTAKAVGVHVLRN
jgi:hypothetical protein